MENIPNYNPEDLKNIIKYLYQQGQVDKKTYERICLPPEQQPEKFSTKKLVSGMFSVGSSVQWAKDLSSIFNIRKIIIIALILGGIWGWGWYKGRLGAPVKIDLEGQEATIKLNDHFLRIEKDGDTYVVDKDGKILKTIRVKDIPGLREKLRPIGFQLKPFVAAGGSVGQGGAKQDVGVGVSYFKYFKFNADALLTTTGLYPLAGSYKLTDNFGVGAGAGVGWKGDKRAIIYGKWEF